MISGYGDSTRSMRVEEEKKEEEVRKKYDLFVAGEQLTKSDFHSTNDLPDLTLVTSRFLCVCCKRVTLPASISMS